WAGGPFCLPGRSADWAEALAAAAAFHDPAMLVVGADGELGERELRVLQAGRLVRRRRQGDDVDRGGAAALGGAERQGAEERDDADHDPGSLSPDTNDSPAADATMPAAGREGNRGIMARARARKPRDRLP